MHTLCEDTSFASLPIVNTATENPIKKLLDGGRGDGFWFDIVCMEMMKIIGCWFDIVVWFIDEWKWRDHDSCV